MWYNCLSVYLLKKGHVNNHICSCISLKKSQIGFKIIVVHVNDLNLVRTYEELIKPAKYLERKFEMKDLGKHNLVSTCRFKHFHLEGWFINQHILRNPKTF